MSAPFDLYIFVCPIGQQGLYSSDSIYKLQLLPVKTVKQQESCYYLFVWRFLPVISAADLLVKARASRMASSVIELIYRQKQHSRVLF
jgi:hypothetical protein